MKFIYECIFAMEHVESLIWTSQSRDRDDCCILGCGVL